MTASRFEAKPAERTQVPLLIGIMSPSGGGKTYSALRLATGMQQVFGGDIFGIDTENRRMLHYADRFKFQHIEFGPPFGSLDYLEALRYCSGKGGRIIIVDSMTHEHIGEGGYLETAENRVTQIAGKGATWKERQKVQMLGWAEAGPKRQKMIEGIKQLDGAFIFCFRAKEKTKPIKKTDGSIDVVDMGFMPLAGEDWVYEMALNCMLEPRSDGVPTWRCDHIGSRMMMKLPEQFKGIFAESAPLSEEIGRKLAQWAKGGTATASPTSREGSLPDPAPERSVPVEPPAGAEQSAQDILAEIERGLTTAAAKGMTVLQEEWSTLHPKHQKHFKAALDRRFKPDAEKVDQEKVAG